MQSLSWQRYARPILDQVIGGRRRYRIGAYSDLTVQTPYGGGTVAMVQIE